MAGINVTFKEIVLEPCVVAVREALHYYSVLFHGQQNEFMEIIKAQYISAFEKLLPVGRTMPEIDDEILAHIVGQLHPALAGNASVPWHIIQRVVGDNAESPARTNLVVGNNIERRKATNAERFLKNNGLVKAHSTKHKNVSFGTIFVRKNFEKKKYDLTRLEADGNNKHIELNPHMTLEFAINHGVAQWDWERFGANANFTWADFETFMQERSDIFTPPPNRPMRALARGYLAKNCNLTVDEFRKIKPLICLSSDLLMRCIARNPFVWHPALYKRHISAARENRRGQLREFMRDIMPEGVAAAVLRYCDCR